MSLSAYKDLRDHHEDLQNARIAAVEGSEPELAARIATVESKTKNITLADEGTGDERHKHTRKLEATDKMIVDSTGDLADATFEAIAHTTNLAGLTLKRGNATTKLVHGSPAASSSIVVNATGNGADDKPILTAVHGSGEMTLGSGASTITAKTNVVEVVPTSGDAALTVKGSTSTSNCTLRLLESQSNLGWQGQAKPRPRRRSPCLSAGRGTKRRRYQWVRQGAGLFDRAPGKRVQQGRGLTDKRPRIAPASAWNSKGGGEAPRITLLERPPDQRCGV